MSEMSWESRVEALEQARGALEAKVAEKDATISSLKAVVDEFQAREKSRRQAEVSGYVSGLKAEAAKHGVAIDEGKLAHVAKLFDAGMDEQARVMGDALLANAVAPVSAPGASKVDLGATPNRAKTEAQYTAEQLRAAGWSVELSADGTQIAKQTPPAAQRAGR